MDESDPDRVRLRETCELRDASGAVLIVEWLLVVAGLAPSPRSALLAPVRRWELTCSEFVADNEGLAIAFAGNYRTDGQVVPRTDLKHAAVVGLQRAIQEFDVTRAGRFSTFAVWKMKHECNNLIQNLQGSLIRVPGQLRDDRRAIDEEIRLFEAEGAEEPPTDDAILERLRAREERAEIAAIEEGEDPRAPRWINLDPERVREIREAHVSPRWRSLPSQGEAGSPRGERRNGTGPARRIQSALIVGDLPADVLAEVRRAYRRLPRLLRAVLAHELNLGIDEDAGGAPECPVVREQALALALRRLREAIA